MEEGGGEGDTLAYVWGWYGYIVVGIQMVIGMVPFRSCPGKELVYTAAMPVS